MSRHTSIDDMLVGEAAAQSRTGITLIPGYPIAISAHPGTREIYEWQERHDVTVVLNADHGQHYRSPVPVLHFPFDDSANVPRRVRLQDAVDAVEVCAGGGRILFHCAAGLNRSALCAAVWLVEYGALHSGGVLTARQAIDLIQAHREGSLFNPHFVAALESWYGGGR